MDGVVSDVVMTVVVVDDEERKKIGGDIACTSSLISVEMSAGHDWPYERIDDVAAVVVPSFSRVAVAIVFLSLVVFVATLFLVVVFASASPTMTKTMVLSVCS